MGTNELRSLCPALQNKTYFNYGGQGPLPNPSLEAITASWARIQELGPFTADIWPHIAKEVNSTRRLLAQCCGVPPHRLALTENVTISVAISNLVGCLPYLCDNSLETLLILESFSLM